jgi:murein DD-endopeptidase MepM/ murein hydrolase activator NlpD
LFTPFWSFKFPDENFYIRNLEIGDKDRLMSKTKYRFNPNTLEYVEVKGSIGLKVLRVFGFLSTAAVFGLLVVTASYRFLDSPNEAKLRSKLDNYETHIKLLQDKTGQIDLVLNELRTRDAQLYREIFGADPLPDEVRNAGFGGVSKYEVLKSFDDEGKLTSLHLKLDQMKKEMYVQSKSYDQLIEVAKEKTKMLASIPAIQPVANKDLKRMASGYGYRIDPIYRTRRFHAGMDFTSPRGTKIYATGDGYVETTEKRRWGYGYNIVINHGYGFKTRYAHMSKFKVRRGERVKRGQVIGLVGSTGKSTAPHLHYEVIKNGKRVNPIGYYYNDLSSEEYEEMLKISSNANQSFD